MLTGRGGEEGTSRVAFVLIGCGPGGRFPFLYFLSLSPPCPVSLAHRPIVLLLGGKKNDNGKLGDLPAGSGGGVRVYGRGVDICGMNIHHLHTHGHEHGFVRLYVGHCRIAMVSVGGNFCRKR